MPFYIRKRRKVGPVNVNLSKTGVGLSLGVRGARLAMGPRGLQVNMGRGGIYYRKSLARLVGAPSGPTVTNAEHLDEVRATSAFPEEIVDSTGDEVLSELNAPRGNWLLRLLGMTKPVPLVFDLDAQAQSRFGNLQSALRTLASCGRVWIVLEASSTDRKHHAGATQLVNRRPIRVGQFDAPRISTNVDVYGIDCGDRKLFFFPDRILVEMAKRYSSIQYEHLKVRNVKLFFAKRALFRRTLSALAKLGNTLTKPEVVTRDSRTIA